MKDEKKKSGFIAAILEKLGGLLAGRRKKQKPAEKPEKETSVEVAAENEIMAEEPAAPEEEPDLPPISFPWKIKTDDSDEMEDVWEERVREKRIAEERGFDVIRQVFFVHESVWEPNEFNPEGYWSEERQEFADFDEYFEYLNGDIYEDACYYQCDFSKISRNVDVARMKEKASFLAEDFEDYSRRMLEEEEKAYLEGEKRKKEIRKWLKRFYACETADELIALSDTYRFSGPDWSCAVDIAFFFWQYIFADPNDRHRFETVMQYMSTGRDPERRMIKTLCHVYGPDEVLEHCDYAGESSSTRSKHRGELRQYVESLAGQDLDAGRTTKVFFDQSTHYYCEKDSYGVCRYFGTFDELLAYRNNDLRNADLRDDIELDHDLSNCITDASTVLPLHIANDIQYMVNKEYSHGRFTATQMWLNANQVPVKQYATSFRYFFDFNAFLKGDLSGANLIDCDGLINLSDISGLNLEGARCSSGFCEKFGIPYDKYHLDQEKLKAFPATLENEKESLERFELSRETDAVPSEAGLAGKDITGERIYQNGLSLFSVKPYHM